MPESLLRRRAWPSTNVGHEILVLADERLVLLDPPSGLVWELTEQAVREGDLAHVIASATGADRGTVVRDLKRLVPELVALGLVERL